MNKGKLLLAAGAALLASTPAQAALVTGQISVGGFASPIGGAGFGTATGYDANNGSAPSIGTPGPLSFYGGGTGSFAGLSCNAPSVCGTIADIPVFSPFVAIPNFLVLNVNGISFDLNSITNVTQVPGADGGSVSISGLGIIKYAGLEDTRGIFSLTAQGGQITSFSASAMAAPVPEPATWGLMLLGFGAVGFAMRRRRQPALLQLA